MGFSIRRPGVVAAYRSDNQKLGPGRVSATYVGQQSCPPTCPLARAGCYAESGRVGIHTRRLNAQDIAALDLAHHEAEVIDLLPADAPLRLHVVGDCATDAAAQTVSAAADRYRARGGQPVWTYTHAQDTQRASWGDVSVLRSCETPAQVRQANADGFAAALIVPDFPEPIKARKKGTGVFNVDGLKVVACCYEVDKTTCADCRICWRDDLLLSQGITVGFTARNGARAVVARLN